MSVIKLEAILDEIAIQLIQSDTVNQDYVRQNQKTIKDGIFTVGRANADRLILFEKDIKANAEDLLLTGTFGGAGTVSLEGIVENLSEDWEILIGGSQNNSTITLQDNSPGSGLPSTYDLTPLLITADTNNDGQFNPLNVSQFIDLSHKSTTVDPQQANEFLDTSIFELLPGGISRQERINNFFLEWSNLKGIIPEFDTDGDGNVDYNFSPENHHETNDISEDNPQGNIVRLREDGNLSTNNSGKTLQDLRDEINLYLKDIDEEFDGLQDERLIYQNKSDGYLKFRELNQGIIIRNTNSQFIDGLNPNELTAEDGFLTTGFTITMWVRFLDKVSEGTLFNFGNPTRSENPIGFKLETIVDEPTETRYVRLMVYDSVGIGTGSVAGTPSWYDSHTGISGFNKVDISSTGGNPTVNRQWLEIPENFNEWYFICANYNPNIDEVNSDLTVQNPDFWLNHIANADGSGGYVAQSGYGNRAKIEIISRSDLLRARGYKE
jgi:hypothetical protein